MESVHDSRAQNDTKKKMVKDFLESTDNWVKKAGTKMETATNRMNAIVAKQCTFKPDINKTSKQLVQMNDKPNDFNQRSEFYEDRKQQRLQRIQKRVDKELLFRPQILQNFQKKHAHTKSAVSAPNFSIIRHSEDSGNMSLNRDLHDLRVA